MMYQPKLRISRDIEAINWNIVNALIWNDLVMQKPSNCKILSTSAKPDSMFLVLDSKPVHYNHLEFTIKYHKTSRQQTNCYHTTRMGQGGGFCVSGGDNGGGGDIICK